METQPQASTPTSTSEVVQHGSRRPSSRPRGRGGRAAVPARQTQSFTFQDRVAQVAASASTPVKTLPVKPLSKEQFSALIDSTFPVSMEPTRTYNDITIDPKGFLMVCAETYRTLVVNEPKLSERFSQSEFVHCCGQVLAYRVLQVRSAVYPMDISGWTEFSESMRPLKLMPEPIALALEQIGLYRDSTGVILRPSIILPKTGSPFFEKVGMQPATLADDYTSTHYELFASMIPFGLLERRTIQQANIAAPLANTANYATQIRPAAASAAKDTVLTTSPHSFFNPFDLMPANPRRVAIMPRTFFGRTQLGLLNSVRWNARQFSEFLEFLTICEKHISMIPFPTSTAGSASFTAVAMPRDTLPASYAQEYDFGAFNALTTAEQHLARLFKFRVLRIAQPDCAMPLLADARVVYNRAPDHLVGDPPLRITTMRTDLMYISSYVTSFILKR